MNTNKQNDVQKKPVGLWTIVSQWANLYYRALLSIRFSDITAGAKHIVLDGRSILQARYADFMHKVNNLPRTNYELGVYHVNQGNLGDATLRFKIALFFNHTIHPAYYYLGRCYYQQLKMDKAKRHFDIYKASGDTKFLAATEFCLTVMQNIQDETLEIPPDIVVLNFNQIADKYDANFIEGRPNIPQNAVFGMLNEYLQYSGKPFGNLMVDLGCGTGYIGTLIREARLAGTLVGVDISPSMMQIARSRVFEKVAVYSQTYTTSIQDFIALYRNANEAKFNVVIGSNLLTYIADISAFFFNVKNIMTPDGIVVLSFKTTEDAGNAIEFDRYLEAYFFSADYVSGIAAGHGFKLAKDKDIKFLQEEAGKVMIFSL